MMPKLGEEAAVNPVWNKKLLFDKIFQNDESFKHPMFTLKDIMYEMSCTDS